MASDFQPDFLLSLYDTEREREVPVAVYAPHSFSPDATPVIFNHGYDKHREINAHSYLDYGYLCRALANEGKYVISIRHDLDSDPLLPMTKPYRENRMPSWEKGECNILYVINAFKRLFPTFRWDKLALIGHSNGGDMVMLTIAHHPELARRVVSLDHRRMPIPRTSHPQILSIRGCDYPADAGVLPDADEQATFGIQIISVPNLGHSDIGSQGTASQHAQITRIVTAFIL
ncbi:MAG: alpha/beta hydrolase [Muribaculaceae bacterium]|nr:alpha/beta hydrolase [Muribaculaceae bacterium]